MIFVVILGFYGRVFGGFEGFVCCGFAGCCFFQLLGFRFLVYPEGFGGTGVVRLFFSCLLDGSGLPRQASDRHL